MTSVYPKRDVGIHETFLSASCTLLTADPNVPNQRPFTQPLFGCTAIPPLGQSRTEMHRLDRNDTCAIEADGPQPVLSGVDTCQGTERLTDPVAEDGSASQHGPCVPRRVFSSSGKPLISLLVGRIGAGAPKLNTVPLAQTAASSSVALRAPRDDADGVNEALAAERWRSACLSQVQRVRKPYLSPPSRSGHVLVGMSGRQSLLLFGGLGDASYNDVWEFSTRTRQWARMAGRCVSWEHFITDTAPDTPDAPGGLSDPAELTPMLSPSRSSAPTEADMYDNTDDANDSLPSFEEVVGYTDTDTPRLPERAFGQAGCACQLKAFPKEDVLAVCGGITDESRLCGTLHFYRPATATWAEAKTHPHIPPQWGSCMETMRLSRPTPNPCNSSDDALQSASAAAAPAAAADGSGEREGMDEQVLVLFGGMTTENRCLEDTYIIHIDHCLTFDEVKQNPAKYLDEDELARKRLKFIQAQIDEERQDLEARIKGSRPPDLLDTGIGAPDSTPVYNRDEAMRRQERAKDTVKDVKSFLKSIKDCYWGPNIEEWKATHTELLETWLNDQLRPLAGTYWVERIPTPPELRGRRRPASAVYKGKYLFIFGGRDTSDFYNDCWVFNVETRMWVPIRAEMPRACLQRFFASPSDPAPGHELRTLYALLVKKKEAAVEAMGLLPFRKHMALHKELYASPNNATAAARTGATMAFDVSRECLYVFGGFALDEKGKYLTYFDMHTYSIRDHHWRRVNLLHTRRWDAHVDGAEDVLLPFNSVEDAREHTRFTTPPKRRAAQWKQSLPQGDGPTPRIYGDGTWRRDAAQTTGMTVLAYTQTHIMKEGSLLVEPGPSYLPTPLPPTARGLVLGHRHERTRPRPCVARRGAPVPEQDDLFPLPVMSPEPRTMSTLVADPTDPASSVFFLFGGRSDDTPLGDMLLIHVDEHTPLDEICHQSQVSMNTGKLTMRTRRDLVPLQLHYRCSVSDGLLRSTSLLHTAEMQLRHTATSHRRGAVYNSAASWLRGVLEISVYLHAITPLLVPTTESDSLAYMAPEEVSPLPSEAPTSEPATSVQADLPRAAADSALRVDTETVQYATAAHDTSMALRHVLRSVFLPRSSSITSPSKVTQSSREEHESKDVKSGTVTSEPVRNCNTAAHAPMDVEEEAQALHLIGQHRAVAPLLIKHAYWRINSLYGKLLPEPLMQTFAAKSHARGE